MKDDLKDYLLAGKENLIIVYVLYLCGIVAPLLALIAAVMVYVNKDVKNELCSSHYIFLLRTFCITFVGISLSTIFTSLLIFSKFFGFLGVILYTLCTIWFILRVAIGFKYLIDNKDHPNFNTLWIK